MYVTNHGGSCCGVKHISGFSYSPRSNVAGYTTLAVSQGASAEMNKGTYYYPGPTQIETGKARLKRLLTYIDSKKPGGHLVEVVLSSPVAQNWARTLAAHGFKKVTSFRNSNTGSILHVYHRVTPLPPKKKKETKKTSSVAVNNSADLNPLPY